MHFAGWATRCVMAVYVKGSSCYLSFKYFFRDCGFKSKTPLLLLQPKHPKNNGKSNFKSFYRRAFNFFPLF